ncbi:MAG: SDR family oxidoreductase [Paracoccus sp. (in: a-proteobacteria)]|uniref:SDR family oxidoreductase n=1 Tax=Paracoccus sp. TaxID=267 RepID=UPI0039E2766D
MDFANKTVLITGGARGIGEATARHFAAKGAKLIVLDVAQDLGEALVAELGAGHRFVKLNVTDPGAWADLATTLDGVDLAFLNAGVMSRPFGAPIFDDPLDWIGPETYAKMADINIGGVVHGISALLPLMRGRPGATFLITSSVAGVAPFAMDPLYAMTKYALVGLATSLAPTLAAKGIKIVTILPRGIETPLTPPDLRQKMTDEGRLEPPGVMAQAIDDILDQAQNGELWVGGGHTESYLYAPNPLRPHKA